MFKPSNPMISGILSLLAELHAIKGLKINNAFCIELVFRSFMLSPADVTPTETLRHLPRCAGERSEGCVWLDGAGPGEGGACVSGWGRLVVLCLRLSVLGEGVPVVKSNPNPAQCVWAACPPPHAHPFTCRIRLTV